MPVSCLCGCDLWCFVISKSFDFPLGRSDPAAFESRLEKRSEFRKQPVGHSKQSEFIRRMEQKVRPAWSFCVCKFTSNPLSLTLEVISLMGEMVVT